MLFSFQLQRRESRFEHLVLGEDAASRSRNREEGVAGGHDDDAETKSWASRTAQNRGSRE